MERPPLPSPLPPPLPLPFCFRFYFDWLLVTCRYLYKRIWSVSPGQGFVVVVVVLIAYPVVPLARASLNAVERQLIIKAPHAGVLFCFKICT